MLLLQSKGRRASHVQQGYEAHDFSSQDASWEPRRLPITLLWLAVPAPHIDSVAPSVSGATHECRAGAWLT